jgi:Na+/phosphate symporter
MKITHQSNLGQKISFQRTVFQFFRNNRRSVSVVGDVSRFVWRTLEDEIVELERGIAELKRGIAGYQVRLQNAEENRNDQMILSTQALLTATLALITERGKTLNKFIEQQQEQQKQSIEQQQEQQKQQRGIFRFTLSSFHSLFFLSSEYSYSRQFAN